MSAFRENFRALSFPLRWILAILGVFVILLLIAQLLLSVFLDDAVGDYLKKEVHTSTDGVYQLQYDDLDLGLLGGTAELENIHLKPNSSFNDAPGEGLKSYPLLRRVDIKALEISGISLWAYLFRNSLAISSVIIDKPVIVIDRIKYTNGKNSQSFSSVDSILFAAIAGQLTALELGAFEIRNGRFSLGKEDQTKDFASVEELNLTLRGIRVDSASARSGRVFVTDDMDLDITGFSVGLPGGFYTVKLSYFELTSSGRQLRADSLQLIPRLPRYNFSAKKGVQTDRIDLLIDSLSIRPIDFPQAVNSGRFYAEELNIENASLDVFHDMDQPPPSGRSPELPHIAFRKLSYPVKIDSIKVENTDIRYTEHGKGVPRPGSVTFENLSASIAGLSNFRKDLESNHVATARIQTEVMGKGLFNTLFTFYLYDPQGTHTIEGHLDAMKFSDFNPVLENLAFAHMEGMVHSLDFSIELNREKARGSAALNYENLHVELLKSETLEQGTGQQVKSFIANTFAIKNKNRPPLREGEIKFERNKQKSAFNFWWKSLSTGLENSIGL